jgi:hypothetical protein
MTLTLLDLGECCFAGTVLILDGSEGRTPSAPKVKVGREMPRVGCSWRMGGDGSRGAPRRPGPVGVVSWTVSSPKVPRGR